MAHRWAMKNTFFFPFLFVLVIFLDSLAFLLWLVLDLFYCLLRFRCSFILGIPFLSPWLAHFWIPCLSSCERLCVVYAATLSSFFTFSSWLHGSSLKLHFAEFFFSYNFGLECTKENYLLSFCKAEDIILLWQLHVDSR